MEKIIEAVIFDLDGVITNTSESHFRAWQRLANEEGIPFTRADNERLRGVSRRQSLEILLAGRSISEEDAEVWMARKNCYYLKEIAALTPKDLLPGVASLLTELQAAGIKIAIASASRNALAVIARLRIKDQLDFCADGSSVERQKPAPDLYLYTARQLGVRPAQCLVVEDAAAGIEAAHAAGMITVGLGPSAQVATADSVFPHLDGVQLKDLSNAATWRVSEAIFKPQHQHHHETILSIGNGYLGTRGAFEERYPGDRQATLVHGIWDDTPICFTELANAPDWTAIEIRVNKQRFSMDRGTVSDYSRFLDLHKGVLHRRLRWTMPANGQSFDLVFERFASLADPHMLAVRIRVESLNGPASVCIRASLDSQVENDGQLHWRINSQESSSEMAYLVAHTRHTQKSLAMCMKLAVSGAKATIIGRDCPSSPAIEVHAELKSGQALMLDKLVSIFTSRDTKDPLAATQSKVKQAAKAGYDALRTANDAAWEQFWKDSDVIIEGDNEAQMAVRHGLYQLRIAASTTDERVSIGAKSLTGFGYRGHVFWDNEIFVVPFFTFTQPDLAHNLLMYRWYTLDGARRKATGNGFTGAQYAWESAETGDEVTPRWVPDYKNPDRIIRIWTGDIQLHITTDVAYAIWQYWQVTGDEEFMCNIGTPIILETALFWGERVESENGNYSIRQIMGPDEYHDHVDNNAFTNRMVKWHLNMALATREWLHQVSPAQAKALDQHLELTPQRLAHWKDAADHLVFLYDSNTGLIEQFEDFYKLSEVDWKAYRDQAEPIHALIGHKNLNHYQVLKQPDVIMLLCLLRDQFNHKIRKANWDYYSSRTDHNDGSSLGPAIHAWAACDLGQPEIAYEHFIRAARIDLQDTRGNSGDGIHIASAGALWQALVFGFAGLRLTETGYKLKPCLPSHWTRLAFSFYLHGKQEKVDLRNKQSKVIDN